MLKIQKLKKHFGGVKAVDGCDLELKQGVITALIGPNGAGKSTVFNLISGIIKTDAGKIVLAGEEITDLSPAKISNFGVSRLFQQSRLFKNLTVEQNLLLAFDNDDTKFWRSFFVKDKSKEEKKEKIEEMLKLVGLEKFKNKSARDLSYGQKRLIELARAILKPHRLLMLDEPVAGVNPALRRVIEKILKDLKEKGETILLIEHDMNFTLNIADEVAVMNEGKVIAQGNPRQIKNNPKVLEAYLGD